MSVSLVARYRVGDLDRFTQVFDEFDAVRRAYGATGRTLLVADAHQVVVMIDFPDRKTAELFAGAPPRLAALERAGVEEREDSFATIAERTGATVISRVPAVV